MRNQEITQVGHALLSDLKLVFELWQVNLANFLHILDRVFETCNLPYMPLFDGGLLFIDLMEDLLDEVVGDVVLFSPAMRRFRTHLVHTPRLPHKY